MTMQHEYQDMTIPLPPADAVGGKGHDNATAKHRRKRVFYRQLERMDCGPTCLQMLASYHGKFYTHHHLRGICYSDRTGVSMEGLRQGAEALGFDTITAPFGCEELLAEAPLPAILHWKQNHYVVLYGPAKGRKAATHFVIADPEHGKIVLSKEEMLQKWYAPGSNVGHALVVQPTDAFYAQTPASPKSYAVTNLPIWNFVVGFKKYFLQLFLCMVAAAAINLFFPLLTQQLVDKGVQQKSLSLIALLLVAQLALFAGNILVTVIQNWTVLYVNARLNIKIISTFLMKLIKLPISFFDTRLMTDIMIRIDDHDRIEHFLSSSSLQVLFSALTFAVLSVVLCLYSPLLFALFLLGSALSITWSLYCIKKTRYINYSRLELMSDSRNNLFEIVQGMSEIKLNNAERIKRHEWEKQQVLLYGVNKRNMMVQQALQAGSTALTHLKTLLITFLAASLVVKGQLTLGEMLSITLIVGQLNQPLETCVEFFQSLQYARISVNRLNDIYIKEDEEDRHEAHAATAPPASLNKDAIVVQDLHFRYNGPLSPPVFEGLDAELPLHKVTAVVGSSGSGKTTLMKLLLQFYEPGSGQLWVGGKALPNIHPQHWRSRCGVVMQDGYIFSDTIMRNIVINEAEPNVDRLMQACRIANIHEFIESLPLGYQTKIGGSGINISAGQRQRILIARAVYRNPDFLFFDEATSALDAHNEKVIMENLQQFYRNRTVMVIAHRLSTVKNADKIIVLEKGKIVEEGTHAELSALRGVYFHLVKNQLELGE
jgi:ATP-binding cassette, subfamily B, bacterial